MAKIAVVLSTDMKNSVIVEGETWDEVEQYLPKQSELFQQLLDQFGVKTYGKASSPAGSTRSKPGSSNGNYGGGVSCADCGVEIQGKQNFKTKVFESGAERAKFGEKVFNRPLCMNDQNGCYAKAKANGEAVNAPRRSSRGNTQQPADELDF